MAIKVFDFFSGCGGTSKGFEDAGMDIVWAIDNDRDAAKTFNINFPKAHFVQSNINDYQVAKLQKFIKSCGKNPILFSGCAPCQPYSQQNKQDDPSDSRRTLIEQFGKFVAEYNPHYVFIENVPGIQRTDPDVDSPFGKFLSILKEKNYKYHYDVVASQSYGVPQKRRRLVLIASRLGEIQFPKKTHGRDTDNLEYSTVRKWIYNFPPIEAGQKHPDIKNHRAAKISDLNLDRLRHTSMGGDRREWPPELQLECHTDYDGHTDVYGRLHWDKLASCLTTKCTSISNGRFGHPVQDRALTGREAASLQTFPVEFVFAGGTGAVARQVGNAVPVLLAKRFGENFITHYQHYIGKTRNG